tara:strand:+ start:262 stop:540 length:279 start_codon:yes stop_codon:yes gene_type:complete
MINNNNDYNKELDKLTESFWAEYQKADVKRQWNSLTRQSMASQNDIVRKYAERFAMLRSLAEMRGVKVDNPGDRGDTVTLKVPASENPLIDG